MLLIRNRPSYAPGAEVLCSGHYNVTHSGHLMLFEFAAQYGSLTVALNGDEANKRKYGDLAVPLINRAHVVGALRCVDNVVFFNENDPRELILKLRPKYFVRGPDYSGVPLIEQSALDEVGCKLIIHQTSKIFNSSKLMPAVDLEAFKPLVP